MLMAVLFLGVATCVATWLAWAFFAQARQLRTRFAGITNVEQELQQCGQKLAGLRQERELIVKENDDRRSKLMAEYDDALAIYKRLKQEVQLLEENLV